MRTRSLLRTALALDSRWTATSQLPPTFLLPWRAQLHQAAQSTQFQYTHSEIPPQGSLSASSSTQVSPTTPSQSSLSQAKPQSPSKPLVLSKSIQQLLPLLHSQQPHYITTHLHRNPYLVTEGDTLRLPFHMPKVSVGDILRLDRASVLGSRDFTLKAGLTGLPPNARPDITETGDGSGEQPYLDERLFVCRARVIGVDVTPLMIKEKTKRRQRKTKTVKSKHRYTVLKITEVRIKSLEELMQGTEASTVILE